MNSPHMQEGASACFSAGGKVPFDPWGWLDAFAKIGGGYALGADRRLAFLVQHCEGDKLTSAMAQIVGRPERQDALKTAIELRQLGER